VRDNCSPHRPAELVRWTKQSNMRPVFTPTCTSWRNRIEPLFAGVRYFALNNSDYADHDEPPRVINAHVAWRNRRPVNAKLQRLEEHKRLPVHGTSSNPRAATRTDPAR
jgi:transposase